MNRVSGGGIGGEVQDVLRRLVGGGDTLSLFCPWVLSAPRCSHSGRTPEAVLSMRDDTSTMQLSQGID